VSDAGWRWVADAARGAVSGWASDGARDAVSGWASDAVWVRGSALVWESELRAQPWFPALQPFFCVRKA
jgi:hypothetical protein